MKQSKRAVHDERGVYGIMVAGCLLTAAALLLPTRSAAIDPGGDMALQSRESAPSGQKKDRKKIPSVKAKRHGKKPGTPHAHRAEPTSETVLVDESSGTNGQIAGIGELGACCVGADCIGDMLESACGTESGRFNFGASCGDDPALPMPICDQSTCRFNNVSGGIPLDDGGAVSTQFAPDELSSVAAADDFILSSPDPLCRMTSLTTWITHPDGATPLQPGFDYDAVIVTIYQETPGGVPGGVPRTDGGHDATMSRGIVYSQTIPILPEDAVSGPLSCLPEPLQWMIDIPIEAVIEQDVKHWVEIQPVLDGAVGRVSWLLSPNNNLRRAKQIDASAALPAWADIAGNADACPLDTPEAGTRTDLAFDIMGQPQDVAVNDLCVNALGISDGVVSFNNEGADTDGPDLPSACFQFQISEANADVWYDYVATCTGTVTVDLCESAFDTVLAVYSGCGICPPPDAPLACNDDDDDGVVCDESGTFQSAVTFDVLEGECFTIRVGGFSEAETGQGVLRVRCDPPGPPTGACCLDGECIGTLSEDDCLAASGEWFEDQSCPSFGCPVEPPPNDDCFDAIEVFTGEPVAGSNENAVGQCSETIDHTCRQNDDCPDGETCVYSPMFTVLCSQRGIDRELQDPNDVWYKWTADCTGAAVIRVCDAEFDTTLTVFDACGGNQLVCNDDGCQVTFQSDIDPFNPADDLVLPVTDGETFFIRIAGFFADFGNFTLLVEPCVSACCFTSQFGVFCRHRDQDSCLSIGGTPFPPGVLCQGDTTGSGIDDLCEAVNCPEATIADAVPQDGTLDARQPHEPDSASPLQGIGTEAEPIVIALSQAVSGAESCFELCETQADPPLSANSIASVTDLGGGVYEIVLTRAIAPGEAATLQYNGGDFVTYFSHPGNVDGDAFANALDIDEFFDCCINGPCVPDLGRERCDTDGSGRVTPADGVRLIDLHNGGDELKEWDGTDRPDGAGCP